MSSNIQGQGQVSDDASSEPQMTPEQELEENLAQALELIRDSFGDEVEGKDKKKAEKDDKARSSNVFAGVDVFGLLGKVVGTPGDAAAAMKAFLDNPGPPGGPKLFPPIRDLRDIPADGSGAGNAWLSGSVFTDLTMVLFEIMPILFQIKLQEAALEAEQIMLLQEVTVKGAEMAMKKKKLEAKEMRLEAYKQFVQAGISIAMAGAQLGTASASSVKGAASYAGSKVKTYGGMGMRGMKMAGNWGAGKLSDRWSASSVGKSVNGKWVGAKNWASKTTLGRGVISAKKSYIEHRNNFRDWKQDMSDRKTLLAGKLKGEEDYSLRAGKDADGNPLPSTGRLSRSEAAEQRRTEMAATKEQRAIKKHEQKQVTRSEKQQQEYARMMARNTMFNAMTSGLTGIAGGLYDLEKAEVREQIGVIEYLQQIFQGLQSVHQKMVDSAHEARREAGEGLNTILQQFREIADAMKAFRHTR